MWEDFSSVNLRVAVPLRWGQENAVAAQWPGSVFIACQAFFFMTLGVNCVSFAARTRQETISADFCHSPADQRGTHHRKSLVSPGHPVSARWFWACICWPRNAVEVLVPSAHPLKFGEPFVKGADWQI